MIDLHTHILPLVDDGSNSLSTSLEILKIASEQGVTGLVCTPHHRGQFNKSPEEIKEAFENFKKEAKKENIPVKLYLGQEVYYTPEFNDLLSEKKILTVNDTKYVLVEFDFIHKNDVCEAINEIIVEGYKPIVAHVERYPYVTIEDILEIRKMGGIITVNADAFTEGVFSKKRRFVFELIKKELVDCVTSDVHDGRKYLMANAAEVVKKKFGDIIYKLLFELIPNEIIQG